MSNWIRPLTRLLFWTLVIVQGVVLLTLAVEGR